MEMNRKTVLVLIGITILVSWIMIKGLETKLEEALMNQNNGMQKQLTEQQRMIEAMQSSLEAISRRDAER